jgi:hypothetical protein
MDAQSLFPGTHSQSSALPSKTRVVKMGNQPNMSEILLHVNKQTNTKKHNDISFCQNKTASDFVVCIVVPYY